MSSSAKTIRHACTNPALRPVRRGFLASLFALARQRRDLARLDDRQLEDVGITRAEAEQEAKRAFWDAPQGWYDRS